MKKVLLSFILLLLCSASSFAQPHDGHKPICYDYINGEYVIKVQVDVSYNEPANNIFVWIYTGVSPYPIPSASTYLGTASEDDEYTDPITGYRYLIYHIAAPNRDYDCIWIVSKLSYGGGAVPAPDEQYIREYNLAKICPCERAVPCDASFNYCVTYDAGTQEYTTTVNLNNQYTWNNYEVDFGETGQPGNIQSTFPATYTYSSNSTASQICVTGVNANDPFYGNCTTCVNICFPDPPKPGQRMANNNQILSTGQVANAFSDVKLYPNPTSSASTLKYFMANSEQLSIKLLDISGRVIKVISNEVSVQGYHSVEINAADLTSGMYIISMETENSTTNTRLSVIK